MTYYCNKLLNNRLLRVFFFSFLLSEILFSCRYKTDISTLEYRTLTDSYQREVRFKSFPQRIVSLSPGITEIIYLLEMDSLLVAVSDYCMYPPQTSEKQRIGGMQSINVEKLVTLYPDLVLIGSIVSKADVQRIEKVGIPVFSLKEEQSIEGLFKTIKMVGDILHKQQKASALVDEYTAKLHKVEEKVVKDAEKTVYYVVGFGSEGDFTAPKGSYIHEIIEYAGGRNVGENLKGWNMNRETLFQEDPDYIFIRKEDLNSFVQTYPYSLLTAVKEKRVFPIESGWIDIVSPRNILAIEYINSLIIDD